MAATIHANARTTPKIRAEIQAAPPSVSNAALARRFGVTKATVAKWRRRDQVHDGSHRPHRLNTTLTEAQEAVVVAVRELLLLPLDDLLVVAWEFLNPNLSRSALDRCLRRHGVNNLKAMLREQEGEAASDKPYKSFKDYEPGFVHVDIKYLPQMAGESARSYLFVAIDRATRWVYLEIRKDKSARSARAFLNKLIQAAPFKIQKILTDNDKAFTDRFSAAGERKPTGTHPFDVLCQAHGIEHRLIKPRRPQTNGMVERFNGRIAEILQTTRFDSSKDLKQTLLNYREVYNHHIPQRALGHVTPIQALKQWQQKRPEIFVKKVYNHAGLDSYSSFQLSTSRDFGESDGVGSYQDTRSLGLAWNHDWTDVLGTRLSLDKSRIEYGGSTRRDRNRSFGIDVEYRARPWLLFGATISHSRRDSNQAGLDYKDNQFGVQVGINM